MVDPAVAPLKAVPHPLRLHPVSRIKLEGDPRGVELASQVLARSLFVREPAGGESADIR